MIDNTAMFKISYGLYVLFSKDEKDNGCIINTATQLTSDPLTLMIAVNKNNYTEKIISKTGVFNLSTLTESTPFAIFERFGFKSGANCDKLADFNSTAKSENGLLYLTEYANAFISCRVTDQKDMGTHTVFFAEITEAKVLSSEPSVTYDYYFKNIKPKPQAPKKKGYVCKICGYVYEGDELPEDFICPICKHPASDFEPIGNDEVKEEPKIAPVGDVYKCSICGCEYDPSKGDPDNGIAPGTPFEALPDDYKCPICTVPKSMFDKK